MGKRALSPHWGKHCPMLSYPHLDQKENSKERLLSGGASYSFTSATSWWNIGIRGNHFADYCSFSQIKVGPFCAKFFGLGLKSNSLLCIWCVCSGFARLCLYRPFYLLSSPNLISCLVGTLKGRMYLLNLHVMLSTAEALLMSRGPEGSMNKGAESWPARRSTQVRVRLCSAALTSCSSAPPQGSGFTQCAERSSRQILIVESGYMDIICMDLIAQHLMGQR